MIRQAFINRICRRHIIKFPIEIKRYVINCLAQEKGLKEIQRMVKETHDKDISIGFISKVYKNHNGEIEEQKNKFLAESLEIPIAQERARLQRDEALYQLSQHITGTKDKVYAGLACLKEAREESKNVPPPSVFQFNQFNQLTDQELLAKKKKLEQKIIDLKKSEVEVGEKQVV